MNPTVELLASVKRIRKALRFCRSIFISTIVHIMHIASVTHVDKLLYLFLVVVSAIFNEVLVIKALKSFDG